MKKTLAMILVLCMALTLACPAFAEGKSPVDGMTVAFIPKVSGNSFFEAANDGAQKYAAEWGLTVDYIGSPDASVTTELELIQQAIDKGVDAICISSVDATALDEKLMEAQDNGIYVSTWDSDVSPNARALMVSQGTADVLGPMLVEMGVESLKERGVDVTGEVKYVWHFSNPSVADQNSWYVAGDEYIKANYPSWVAVHDPYYSNQDPAQSVSVGESIFEAYPDVDLIICNDSTALPGQCGAAQNKGLTAKDVTITGFCPPSGMTTYLENGICTRWGLWDCGIQGALGCYLAPTIEDACEGADVVMGLRIQRERQQKGLFPSVAEYCDHWEITPERVALARPNALVMHPGPMNRGVEIASSAADSAQSVITQQVESGVSVRMALLYMLTRREG